MTKKKIQAKDKYRQKEYKLKKRGWEKRYKSLTGSNKINTSQWGIACIYFVVWVYELYKKDTSQVLACTYFYSEVCVFVKMIQVTKMCESVNFTCKIKTLFACLVAIVRQQPRHLIQAPRFLLLHRFDHLFDEWDLICQSLIHLK